MSEQPSLTQPVRRPQVRRPHVERHDINWDVSDFSDLTLLRIGAMGEILRAGCYYLNPLYTVSCPEPTDAFYRKAIWARDGWIKLFKDTISPRGLRRLSKEIGTSAWQLQVSGVMYLDGFVVPPHRWEHDARIVRNPDLASITSASRQIIPLDLRTSKGQQSLAALCRSELRRILSSQPAPAGYVTPAFTLSAPRLTPTFLAEARKAENQWHRRLHEHLGKDRKTLARSVDPPSRMLAFLGTFVAGGLIYLPGFWPDTTVTEKRLLGTPFRSPTVPPEYLGLDLAM